MKKKINILIFILIFCYCHANNNYYIVNFYKPYGREPTYTEEFLFYDDGLIKRITHYDLRNECDYYDWENIRKNLKIIRQYEISRLNKSIEVVLKENHTEKTVKKLERINDDVVKIDYSNQFNSDLITYKINLQSMKELISNYYINLAGEKVYLIDNRIQRLIHIPSNKKFADEEQKLAYDGQNVYRIATNHPYGEETTTVNFLTDYIPFTKENAVLNFEISNNTAMSVTFFSVPTIPKSTVMYTDFKDKSKAVFVDNKNKQLSFNVTKPVQRVKYNQFGFDYYIDNNDKKLLLKNENLSVLYEKEESKPYIIGLADGSRIVQAGQIESSSFLKEDSIEYKAENLKSLKLKHRGRKV